MKTWRGYDMFMAAKQANCTGVDVANAQRELAGYPLFLIDDAHLCFYNTIDARGGCIDGEEMPPIVIPFNRFWMEWGLREHDNTPARLPNGAAGRVAAFCEWDSDRRLLHITVFNCVLLADRTPIVITIGKATFSVSEAWVCAPPLLYISNVFGERMQEAEYEFSPPRFALGLLAAKNVTREESSLGRGLRRHPGQFSATASDKHYTLRIPGVAELRSAMASGRSAGKRLHIVRGHFADYSEGGGLFGKLHGRYYIAPHVRGDVARGTVVKDYRLASADHSEAPR